MKSCTVETQRINVSIPVGLLVELFESGQLCAADLSALDADAHRIIRSMLLDVCARKLKAQSTHCGQCALKAHCINHLDVLEPTPIATGLIQSFCLH